MTLDIKNLTETHKINYLLSEQLIDKGYLYSYNTIILYT